MLFRDLSVLADATRRGTTELRARRSVVAALRSCERRSDASPAFPASAFPIVMLCRQVIAAADLIAAVEKSDAGRESAVVVGIIDSAAEIQSAYCTCSAYRACATCPHIWVASYVLVSQGRGQ
jgi:hypothetical protein